MIVDAWRQSFTMLPPGTSLERRFEWAYQRASISMFITSLTTAIAFVANGVSAVPPIRLFGYFMALLVAANYLLVITWFPAVIVVHHRYCGGSKRTFCCGRKGRRIPDCIRNIDSCCYGGREGAAEPAAPPGELEEAEPECMERCFRGCWTDNLYFCRYPVALALLGLGIWAGVLVFRDLSYATQEVQVSNQVLYLQLYAVE